MRKWSYSGNFSADTPLFIGLIIADIQVNNSSLNILLRTNNTMPVTIKFINSKINYTGDCHVCWDSKRWSAKTRSPNRYWIRNTRDTYMPFSAQLMIQLGCYTEVTVVADPPSGFPKYIYNITPFEAIKTTDGPPSIYTGTLLQHYKSVTFFSITFSKKCTIACTDVIGYITKISAPSTRTVRGKDTPSVLREVLIKDIT